MTEPIVRQPVSTEEVHEHEDSRFAHWEEEQTWEKEAQQRKMKIIASFVVVGVAAWAWMVFR